MKTISKTLMLISGLMVLGSVAVTADPVTKAKATPAVLVCPVTGDKIASIKDAVGHSTYKGKTYYFCCAMCKPLFDKDPAKYVHPAKAASSSK